MKESVKRFWNWFSNVEEAAKEVVSAELSDSKFREQIENELNKYCPGLLWELGPNGDDQYQLVISSGRNVDNDKFAKELIENAPSINGWTFVDRKPPKEWSRIMLVGERQQKIDFSDFEYVLTAFDGRQFFDITFFPPSGMPFNEKELKNTLRIFIENEIGEALAIEKVGKIEISTDPSIDDQDRKTCCEYFRPHFLSLIQGG